MKKFEDDGVQLTAEEQSLFWRHVLAAIRKAQEELGFELEVSTSVRGKGTIEEINAIRDAREGSHGLEAGKERSSHE
jgi:hypothetical protein